MRALPWAALLLVACGSSSHESVQDVVDAATLEQYSEICDLSIRGRVDDGEIVRRFLVVAADNRPPDELPTWRFKNANSLIGITQEITSACVRRSRQEPQLQVALEDALKAVSKSAAADAEKAAAWQRVRSRMAEWDSKLSTLGSGGVAEYLSAGKHADQMIQSGAKYGLTGVEREVDWASCSATERSLWISGRPRGWWNCYVNFLGADGETYSVEFSMDNWSGTPDGGDAAGRTLTLDIPQDVVDWVQQYGAG